MNVTKTFGVRADTRIESFPTPYIGVEIRDTNGRPGRPHSATWKTKAGTEMKVTSMTDAHLLYAIQMVQRKLGEDAEGVMGFIDLVLELKWRQATRDLRAGPLERPEPTPEPPLPRRRFRL